MDNNEKLNKREKFELVVESGLQLIPMVGGALSSAYFGYKNEKRFKRLESFYSEFSNLTELNPVGIDKHDQDVLVALIDQLNDKVEKEVLEEKRLFFRNFLRSSLENPTSKQNFDERRFFLETLADMTLLEIEILTFIFNSKQPVIVGTLKKPGVEQFAIVGSIARIKNYGFLTAIQNSFSVGAGHNELEQAVELNEFGRRFVNFSI